MKSSGNITGPSGLAALLGTTGRLRKEGSDDLILTSAVTLNGGLEIAEGSVQLGDGGTTGSFSSGGSIFSAPADIAIDAGAKLVVNRSNNLALSDAITGGGELVKKGAGVLNLTGSNSFGGGLTVLEGYVTGAADDAYGAGTITLDGGGLRLSSDVYRDVVLGSNHGSLQVTGANTYRFGGQLLGAGNFNKVGTGTLIYTGVASPTGQVNVQEGILQISEAYSGTFLADVNVQSGAELVFGRDDLTQYDYIVSGAGNVIKRGTGELVLTGDHLFTGDLNIENGVVRLGYGGSTGGLAGGAVLAAGSELVVDRSGTAEISGSLQGSGTLRQVGSGQLRLPGDSSLFTGNTLVQNGSLRIDGRLGGDVTLQFGTGLQGVGSILGDLTVNDGAYFTPGNSFGTFTVGGNLTLNSSSELRIEVDELGGHDDVQVGGVANLAGTLKIIAQPGTYLAGCCNYTILQAAGGVNGTFSTVDNPLAFLNTVVTYTANEVNLSLARNGSGFGSVSNLTWNQQQVSNSLDQIEAVDPSHAVVSLITPLTADQARSAYDSLSGDSLLAQANMAAISSRRFTHLLSQRSSRLGLASRGNRSESMENSLSAVREGRLPEAPIALAKGVSPQQYDGPTSVVEGVWVEASAFTFTENGDSVIGSAESDSSGKLFALGADGYWADNIIVGFGLGQLQSDISFGNRQASGEGSGTFAGIYSRIESRSGWHYKVALAMGQQDTDQKRTVTVGATTLQAQSTASIDSLSAGIEAGLALHLGSYGMRPYAMLDMQTLKRSAFQETGAGAANLSVAATTDQMGEFGVGIELSRPWLTDGARWAQLQTGLALVVPFGDTQREQSVSFSGTASQYRVKATAVDTPSLQFTVGGEWYFTPTLALWGGYEGRVSSASQEHNGVISIQYRW